MKISSVSDAVSVSDQIHPGDVAALLEAKVSMVVCNRPDKEAVGQPDFIEISKALTEVGIESIHLPFSAGTLSDDKIEDFAALMAAGHRIHAYCRTGNRSSNIWQAAQSLVSAPPDDLPTANKSTQQLAVPVYDVVIVGAGSAGIATAASLLKRKGDLRIALIDPAAEHFYQPGWTMVGGGIFDAESTKRMTQDLIPNGVTWIQEAVQAFNPSDNSITTTGGNTISYSQLVVAAGLKLDWDAVEGLNDALGSNGVTSNYRYNLAPYTWDMVRNLKKGNALFTQPAMPIKCAGAPQKALYLSADHWLKNDYLKDINVQFHNAGGALFGVAAYVPALQSYMDKYGCDIRYSQNLTRIDGSAQKAWFQTVDGDGNKGTVECDFDFIHVCPPQCAPDFISNSALSDDAGWLDVDQHTLQHKTHANVWGAGDVTNTPNAKTMAAARKQAGVLAQNICDALDGRAATMAYDGYGACPLTVERGKIVLAEFSYGGALSPTFPTWMNDGTKASSFAWHLKASVLPNVYWHAMLKGNEWLARPKTSA